MKANGIEGKYIEYKGKPLVRKEDEIYYGFMSDKFYLYMLIMNEEKAGKLDVQIPNMVMMQIRSTKDGTIYDGKQKVCNSLSDAFDLGTAWLERANRA